MNDASGTGANYCFPGPCDQSKRRDLNNRGCHLCDEVAQLSRTSREYRAPRVTSAAPKTLFS